MNDMARDLSFGTHQDRAWGMTDWLGSVEECGQRLPSSVNTAGFTQPRKKTALYYYFSRHRSFDATQQNLQFA